MCVCGGGRGVSLTYRVLLVLFGFAYGVQKNNIFYFKRFNLWFLLQRSPIYYHLYRNVYMCTSEAANLNNLILIGVVICVSWPKVHIFNAVCRLFTNRNFVLAHRLRTNPLCTMYHIKTLILQTKRETSTMNPC